MEVAYEAVVNPQPRAVAEGMAVGLLDCRARGGSDVGEEQRRVYVARDLAEVAVVPGRLDTSEDGRDLAIRVIPSDPEAVAVCGIDAQASMAALVDEGVLRFVEQLLDEDGRARAGEPAAHLLLLSFRRLTPGVSTPHGRSTKGLASVTNSPFRYRGSASSWPRIPRH